MILRKILKISGRILLGLLGFLIVLLLFLQLSFVQTFLTHKISKYLSKELKTNIHVGKVDISLLLHLRLEEVYVEDLSHNNLLKASRIDLKISSINFPKHIMNVPKISISDLDFRLRYYKNQDDINLQFLIDYFCDTTSVTESKPWTFKVSQLKLVNSRFRYDIDDDPFESNGMDYSHLNIRDINLELRNFKNVGDTMFANIISLSAKDKCGFRVLDLHSDVKISSAGLYLPDLHLKTPGSDINVDLHFDYDQWTDWIDYIDKMKMILKIKPSVLAFNEISAFSTYLQGMNDTFNLQGDFKGTVASFKVKDFKLEYAKNSVFEGSIKMDGLPDIEKTFIMVKIDKLVSSNKEIESIYLPDRQHISLPSPFSEIGDIKVKGRFTGYYYDFVSNATLITSFGQITTDISLQPLSGSRSLSYNGNLQADDFQIGRLLKTDNLLGKVSLNADISGIGLDDSTNATFKINISSLELDNYLYKNVTTIGKIGNKKIVAQLHSSQDEFNLDVSGEYDYRNVLSKYKVLANVENIRLARITRSKEDTLGEVSAKVDLEMMGNNLDNFDGSIYLDSVIYNYKNKKYDVGKISLLTHSISEKRNIDFKSKYFDLSLTGKYKISDFEPDFKSMLSSILPSVFPKINFENQQRINKNIINSNIFDLKINFKNSNDLMELFFPSIYIATGSNIYAHYEKLNDSLNINLNSSALNAYGLKFENLKFTGVKSNDIFTSSLVTNKMNIADSLSFDKLSLNVIVSGDSIYYTSKWGISGTRYNRGLLNGNFNFISKNEFESNIQVGEVIFNDSLWIINPGNKIVYKDHYISVDNFSLSSGENKISANGILSDDPNEKLIFEFKNFNLDVVNPFIQAYIPPLGGIINGEFEISNIWESVNFYSNLNIYNLSFNKQFLGLADIQSRWSTINQAVIIDMGLDSPMNGISMKTLDVHGFYYPYNQSNNFDISIELNKFPIKPIDYLLTSFSSLCEGIASGNLKILGSVDHPILQGEIYADVNALKIDYTNTIYSFKDFVHFDEGLIALNNVTFFDPYYTSGSSNQAIANLSITHKNFSDFYMNLNVAPTEALVMNTTYKENPIYYGKAFASGKLTIKGPFDDLKMNIDVESKKGTSLSFSLEDDLEVQKYDFVTFKKPQSIIDSLNMVKIMEENPFYLDLNLNAKLNQEASIELVMNREINDVITAKGYGDIKMNINEEGDIKIYGKYNITKGDYNFIFNNVKFRQFQIVEGSNISWNGNIDDAKVDIIAQYKLNARLSDLLGTIDNNEIYKRKTKVICQINIRGDLYNMSEPVFSILLPDETNDTKEKVNRLLNVGDDNSSNNYFMNLNFLSLLVTGQFQPATGQNFDMNPQSLSTNNATEILANQLGSVMGKVIKDVDLGLNWNPSDSSTTQEITIEFTKSMLNNRLIIDGKFGGGGELRTSQTSRIIGDVDIAYKITDDGRLMIKAYNRTNYDEPGIRKAPYTQGAGFVYRKDFDSFSELFRKKQNKNKEIPKK